MTTPTPHHPPMAPQLTDTERAEIRRLIEAGHSRNDIATRTGRSHDTVTRIAREIGHTFGQKNMAHAHGARSAYSAERRALLAGRATERAAEALEMFGQPQQQVVATRDGAEVVEVRMDARAWKDLAAAVGALVKTVLDVDRHDNRDDGAGSAFDQWLASIAGGDT